MSDGKGATGPGEPEPSQDRGGPRRWVLILLAVAVLTGGATLVATASSGASAEDEVAATAKGSDEEPPTTPQPEQAAPAPSTAGPTTAAPAFGPEVGTHSAQLDDLHTRGGPSPVAIRIGDIQVDAPVSPAGVVTDGSEELEVPSQADAVVWYEFGPSPGAAGSAVVAGHVDYDGAEGVFFHLADVQPGALVSIDYDDGAQRQFQVTGSRKVAKVALPTDEIFTRDGPPQLNIITCGGEFDSSAESYRDNVVVEAVPVAS